LLLGWHLENVEPGCRPCLRIDFVGLTDLVFETVAQWPLLIKDLLPIATTSRQHSSKPHVSGCF